MRCIEHRSDSQLPEPELVVRHKPDKQFISLEITTELHVLYVYLNKAGDTHMSPRNRLGHTSSQWRQDRGALCKTSSSSWTDGTSHVLFDSFVTHVHLSSSPPGSVPRSFLRSGSAHLTSATASVISKTGGRQTVPSVVFCLC